MAKSAQIARRSKGHIYGLSIPPVSFPQPLPCPANAGFFPFRGESNPSKTTLRLTAIILNHGSSRKPRSRTRKRLRKGDLRNSQTTNMPLQLCDRFEHFSPRASYLRSRGCSLTPAKSSNRSRWVFENRVTPFRVLPCLPWLKPNPSKTTLRLNAIEQRPTEPLFTSGQESASPFFVPRSSCQPLK